ncbi:MAG: DHH family phosphoesterase [Candidatus Thorarchaeota archaeon]|nr:DHH family phosphoesterase [Candidatus Thorarchaeota archaeon]
MTLRQLIQDAQHVLIMGHHNADPDALCSMIAFERLYHALNPEGNAVLACEDVSKLSTQVVRTFIPLPDIVEVPSQDFDLYVILDTNNTYQLGEALENLIPEPDKVLIIDHHTPNPDISTMASHLVVQSERSSTCEILVSVFQDLEVPITAEIANLLLSGILFDTRRFFYADDHTFHASIALIDAGADYNLCLQSLIVRPDRSERIARLRAASRLKIHLINDWIIVTSRIGAYEASASRAIIDLGADVAIVGGRPSKNAVRLSARSTKEFYSATGVSLGRDVMAPLGPLIDGEGGGHPNAGGANGTKNLEAALKEAVELVRSAIKRGPLEESASS